MTMDPPGKTRREVVSGLLVVGATVASPVAAADEFKFGLTPVFLTNDLELLARLRDYLQRRTATVFGSSPSEHTRKSRPF